MSRFDFDDDGERHITWQMWQWNLTRALHSKNGHEKLREFRDALMAVPGHRLVRDKVATIEGEVCAIGAFAAFKQTQNGKSWAEATADLNQRLHPVSEWWVGEDETDAWSTQYVGIRECGLNATLAWQLAYQNDEEFVAAGTPEELWQATYDWVRDRLAENATGLTTNAARA